MSAELHPLHQRLLTINEAASAAFIDAEAARRRAWATHPTRLACVKCMDGRIHMPSLTGAPIGMIKPLRAMGGRFEAFWPSFLGRVRAWVDRALSHGARAAMMVSYHHSDSELHLGCSGWAYDTAAARAHATRLADELAWVFGDALSTVVLGIETDNDVLTLHGERDISGRALIGADEGDVLAALEAGLPGIPPDVRRDLAPLMLGNARRVAELARAPRTRAELGHHERVLAVGQGFDWLAQENTALVVDDADPAFAEAVRVAAGILAKNLERAGDGGAATILVSVPYAAPGIDRRQAVARARGLLRFAEQMVAEAEPTLAASGRWLSLASVLWEPARRLELLD